MVIDTLLVVKEKKIEIENLRTMVFSMILMALVLGVAGIVQAYLQRVLGMDYLTTQGFMKLWYAVFWVSG